MGLPKGIGRGHDRHQSSHRHGMFVHKRSSRVQWETSHHQKKKAPNKENLHISNPAVELQPKNMAVSIFSFGFTSSTNRTTENKPWSTRKLDKQINARAEEREKN